MEGSSGSVGALLLDFAPLAVYDDTLGMFVALTELEPEMAGELFQMAKADLEEDGHPHWSSKLVAHELGQELASIALGFVLYPLSKLVCF